MGSVEGAFRRLSIAAELFSPWGGRGGPFRGGISVIIVATGPQTLANF